MSGRTVSILGATGSVGQATIDLIERAPEGQFDVVALTANSSVDDLAAIAKRVGAKFCGVADPSAGAALAEALSGTNIAHGSGPEAILDAARMDADWLMAAIVGAAGLAPTLEAVRRGAFVAFANKEALVCAGTLFMSAARASGATLLPVDSEHNAIFQGFDELHRSGIRRIILTASGGPFRNATLETMREATPEQAVAHPTWSMGAKISVDSATMFNKGLEIIEACHLFDLPESEVDVLIHPESIVHGLVEYADGGMLAQLGEPDMRTPIGHALAWPDRMETPVKRLDLAQLSDLTFQAVDAERFKGPGIARQAFRAGGGAPAVLNAANEVAVDAFLNRKIGFLDIAQTVLECLERGDKAGLSGTEPADFDAVYEADRQGRLFAAEVIEQRFG